MYSIFITLLVITIKPFAMRLSYLCINLVMGRKNGWRPKSVLTEKKLNLLKTDSRSIKHPKEYAHFLISFDDFLIKSSKKV